MMNLEDADNVEAQNDDAVLDNAQEGAVDEVPSESEGEEEHEVIGFDDEGDAPDDTPLVARLREKIREDAKELARYRAGKPAPGAQVEVGEKPRLEDFDYDEDKFDVALEEWSERKVQAALQKTETDTVEARSAKMWQQDVTNFETRKNDLRVPDRDEAFGVVKDTLNDVQAATIIQAASDPAALMYALGKSPGKLAQLSTIENPIKLAAEVARLERTMKVTSNRKAPPPESIPSGGKPHLGGADKERERLEKEAARTGDRTALIAYNKRMREKA